MFGVSFLEIAVIGLIALIVVGPQKLPTMMRTLGEWLGKLRRLTSDMRAQTGIDDILREEGIDGVAELRNLLRGTAAARPTTHSTNMGSSRYTEAPDASLEFPMEGADAGGALPEDLFLDETSLLEDSTGVTATSESDSMAPSPPSNSTKDGPSEGSGSSEAVGTTSTP